MSKTFEPYVLYMKIKETGEIVAIPANRILGIRLDHDAFIRNDYEVVSPQSCEVSVEDGKKYGTIPRYCEEDIKAVNEWYAKIANYAAFGVRNDTPKRPTIDEEIKQNLDIKKIVVNGPATIVFWNDNTKTIVKCMETDTPDIEKAILMAYFKRKTGFTKTRTQKVLKKLIGDIQDTTENNKDPDLGKSLEEAFKNVSKELVKVTEGFKGLYKEGNKDNVD